MTKLIQDVNLGVNLQKIRRRKGYTQQDICAKLELAGRPMTLSTYAQIETGVRNIFLSDLITLRKIFGVEYEELFYGLRPVNKYKEL